jgi:hypothetical protein
LAQVAYGALHRAAVELLTDGTYTSLASELSYGELNALADA